MAHLLYRLYSFCELLLSNGYSRIRHIFRFSSNTLELSEDETHDLDLPEPKEPLEVTQDLELPEHEELSEETQDLELPEHEELSEETQDLHLTELMDPSQELTADIKKFYVSRKQTEVELTNKKLLKDNLQQIIQSNCSQLKSCRLVIYGSTMTGLSLCSGDLDITVNVNRLSHLQLSPGHLQLQMLTSSGIGRHNTERLVDQNALRSIHQCLRDYYPNKLAELELVMGAAMPLVKAVDTATGFTWQMSLANKHGVINTRLLQIYSKCDDRVAPLVVIIKEWARIHGINSARDNFPNNYCWTLLVIFYLQAGCSPPVVPCLHKQFKSLVSGISEEDDTESGVPDPHFTSKNKQSLGELLTGFFKYYSDTIRCGQVFSLREGQLVRKNLLSSRPPRRQWQCLLCVEDQSSGDNVPRSVFKEANFHKIVRAMNDTVDSLKKGRKLEAIL